MKQNRTGNAKHSTNRKNKSNGKRTGKQLLRAYAPHLIVLGICLIIVFAVFYRVSNWGEYIDLDEFFKDHEVQYQHDYLDQILPLTREDGSIIRGKEKPTILFMGNAPFADDRYSEDGLVNMIADMTGSTVYNCSVEGSYLAAMNPAFDSRIAPMDAFNFYWMCQYMCNDIVDHYFEYAKSEMPNDFPKEAQEVFDTLNNVDMNTIDVLAIMYDASDYLAGHQMYNDQNPTDISQFTGNMEAGIELIQQTYPHIRIIVLSPTYAFGVDEDGNYVSSDIKTYGQDVLSTYIIRQCYSASTRGVTFVDNLYGTITEDNASEYLTDNLHLNVEGRKKVAERFLYALNYYNE